PCKADSRGKIRERAVALSVEPVLALGNSGWQRCSDDCPRRETRVSPAGGWNGIRQKLCEGRIDLIVCRHSVIWIAVVLPTKTQIPGEPRAHLEIVLDERVKIILANVALSAARRRPLYGSCATGDVALIPAAIAGSAILGSGQPEQEIFPSLECQSSPGSPEDLEIEFVVFFAVTQADRVAPMIPGELVSHFVTYLRVVARIGVCASKTEKAGNRNLGEHGPVRSRTCHPELCRCERKMSAQNFTRVQIRKVNFVHQSV